jgi:integrase
MGSVVRYRDGWRAYVYSDGKRRTKLFRLKSEAQAWADATQSKTGHMTFGAAAERWLAWKLPQLDNANNVRTVEQSIREHVLPAIGDRKLADLKRADLVAVVRAVATDGKVETAHRLGQRIRAIFDHAVDHGDIESHAAAGLSRVLPVAGKTHQPAVSPSELPDLLKAIHGYSEPVTRLGLLLLAHTFVRTSELIGARWEEIRSDVWVIPESRMKRRIPHVVPLSEPVRELLKELRMRTGEESEYILASRNPRQPISNNTLLFALYRLGYRGRMTGHGFRALASTILNESGLWSRDCIERQLAHSESDQVRASYMRAEFLAERVKMMAWWSERLAAASSA